MTVQQLNPTSDPGGSCPQPYSSGSGFQGTPQVVSDNVSLSQFDNQSIQLRFYFTTGDNLYNEFEGWYVKNIKISGVNSNGSPVTVFSDAVSDGDSSFTGVSDYGTAPGWHVSDRRDSTFGGPSWWYGNEATGTYQSPNPSDSCTDSSANSGTITTGPIQLPTNTQLSFDTLWQIESVNPASFDLLDVQVIPPAPLAISSPTGSVDGTAGSAMNTSLVASGGNSPYFWSIPTGKLPTGLSVTSISGATSIDGTPAYAGTSTITLAVTDSSTPTPQTAEETLDFVIGPSSQPTAWNLVLNTASGNNTPPVIVNPHIAYVLVGTWWCPLTKGIAHPPKICKNHTSAGSAVEQGGFLGALDSMVIFDYNSSYDDALSQYYQVTNCGFAGFGCTNDYVGSGATFEEFTASGLSAAGPISEVDASSSKIVATLQTLLPGFNSPDQANTGDTVFVLLYAPTALPNHCTGNPSTNTRTSSPGFAVANVFLEDTNHQCTGDLSSVNATQFATWASSHEIDEAITNAGTNTSGWGVIPSPSTFLQIADPCTDRNAFGQTGYSDPANYPFGNHTRDSIGTVVAAYVDPNSHLCTPGVETSIPPG